MIPSSMLHWLWSSHTTSRQRHKCISGSRPLFAGDAEAGIAHARAALSYAEDLRHPHSICYVLPFFAGTYLIAGNPQAAIPVTDRAIAQSNEHGFPQWVGGRAYVAGLGAPRSRRTRIRTGGRSEQHQRVAENRNADLDAIFPLSAGARAGGRWSDCRKPLRSSTGCWASLGRPVADGTKQKCAVSAEISCVLRVNRFRKQRPVTKPLPLLHAGKVQGCGN